MADLSEFSRTDFNPKAWINAAVAARQPDEALER